MAFDLLQSLNDALARSSSYALLGTGFTLVFGVLRRIDLAYGASILFGLAVAIWTEQRFEISPVLLAPIAVLATTGSGVYVERLCFAPHAQREAIIPLAASFAVWMQLEEIGAMLLPGHVSRFSKPFASTSGTLRPEHLVALASAVGFAAAFWLLLYRTHFGLAARAVIANRQAASCVGIDVARVSSIMFALASMLGGFAGYLIASIDGQITPMFAMWATLKGMTAAAIGGLGSLPGAVFGGLTLGIFESFGQRLFGAQERDLATYLLLLGILLICPKGLFPGGSAAARDRRWVSRWMITRSAS
jgi:branched-chain amino acid transport system permease protein